MNEKFPPDCTARTILIVVVCLLAFASKASGQSIQRLTDGTTPLGIATGSPEGSYSLSDLESINLYNGSMSLSLPIVKIAGRGGAGYTMVIRIEHKWLVERQQELGVPNKYIPTANWWNLDGFNTILSAGRLDIRKAVSRQPPDLACGAYIYHET